MKRVSAILLLLLVVSPIIADDTPPAEPEPNPTIEAWTALQSAQAESRTLRDAVSGLFQKMESDEGKAAAREVFMTALKKGGALVKKAEDEFCESFDNSDWEQWNTPEHSDLYRTGLDLSARNALDGNPQKAIEAYDLLITSFPESDEAARARTTWLPIALPAAGDYGHAVRRLRKLYGEASDVEKPGLQMAIGDTLCAKGDTETALKEFEEALAEINAAGELEKYDRRNRVRRYLELRLALIGQPAPEVDSEHWFGAEARKLSDLKGTVVVLDYWATW